MSVWRVQVRDQRDRVHDVFLDAEPATSTAALGHELDRLGFHVRPFSVNGRTFGDVDTIADLDLVHGDLITSGRIDHPAPTLGSGRHLVVVCGPDAGQVVALDDHSSLVVGRSDHARLTLDDELLSAQHCRVDVERDVITVTDLGSTNGTFVEGAEIDGTVTVEPGTHVQVGSSVLTIADVAPTDLAVVGNAPGPDRVFSRQYRSAQTPFPKQVDAPRAPGDSSSIAGMMWWRALLPVVTGFGFAAVTGRWIFLLIMVVSPIVIAFDALRRKRRRSRDDAEAEVAYRRELAEFRDRVRALRRAERARRRDASHCGGLSLLLARTRHRRMWERVPGDPDFAHVSVGLGPAASDIAAKDPDDELEELQWGTPVQTDLIGTGSLGIVGERRRARAAARAVVLNLAGTHSPADVRLWVLSRDVDGRDWGFVRWLPHTFAGPQTSAIAVTETDRAELVKTIKQLVDTRAELERDRRDTIPLPVHVVVIDGVDLLEPGELTDLLRRGPALGVVAITIDDRLAPEGVGATLTLGHAADLAVFDSRHQPRVEGIMVAEVAAGPAEAAGRRMAALRPSSDEQSGDVGGVCHLVEIESLTALTPDGLVERWGARSPDTVATVGMASETPMHVDLVTDGPHGLIGGTSGSGKTEFLKTMFVSLCLNNHPDDLAIVVVDFKGGVDHDAIRPLPHVIDVATNLDIDQFERTIVMLDAEQKRRQGLLAAAGANNIDSYRQARRSRPELPPLPRLVVVVDEFGELLAAEGGRDKLRELESITRIGRALGVHLLLVTQNFEGNLPGQIDANAGLRISLRVQKAAHSKAVLDSGVAASIPDRRVGRAYARFHGRELIEFQTARVAGRRRDLEPEAAQAHARIVAFETLAVSPPGRASGDVPNEETDMYALVECCRQAAAATGWTRSAVPWPSALPDLVSVSALAARHQGEGIPIGLTDLPDQQRRETALLTDRTQQLVVIGGSSAPVPEVLTTFGATTALLRSPDEVHLYAIDLLGSSLAQLAELPHCGGVAVRNEHLALRIVRWLVQQAAERKIAMAGSGSSNIWQHAAATGEHPPQLVLLMSGADRMLSSDDSANQNLRAPLQTLMSEAVGVGIQIVLGGLPKLVHTRLGANVADRLVLELADPAEYTGVGAPKASAGELRVPRRAVQLPGGRTVQLAQLSPAGASDGAAITLIAESLPAATSWPPHRFVDVPWPLAWQTALTTPRDPAPPQFVAPLPLAIETNTGEWAWIDAVDDGPVFAVAGPPKSGRSTMLAAMARFAVEQGWSVVNATTSRRSPLTMSPDPALSLRCEPSALGDALQATSGRCLVVIDDLQRLESADGIEAALDHKDRVLLAIAAPPDFLSVRTGLMRGVPPITAGALLAPPGALDGSAIGLRRLPAEWTTDPRPGRGILAIAGEPTEIQVPLLDISGVATG